MKSISEIIKEKPWVAWALFAGTMILVFVIGLFASSIMERRSEALVAYTPSTGLSDTESNNNLWQRFFPREFESWKKTKESDFASKYNGNIEQDALAEDPRMIILWAGYGFAKEYNKPRGHMWAVEDLRKNLRSGAPKVATEDLIPATCWTCKSPDVPRVISQMGATEFYRKKWSSLGAEILNPIGCADCHDSKTMNLRPARPALTEAFARQGKDLSKENFQSKRSLVCAQCHVEYYFKGEGKYLTFPWDKGMGVDEMEKYYDEIAFSDWTHPLSKTPMLKAQHPDYELYTKGIHFQRGLSCADCHMPYQSEGGVKVTNHHIVSPLKYVATTCQVCHRESEENLRQNVYERQDKINERRLKTEDLLVRAHFEAQKAWEKGATEKEMQPVLQLIRHASWRWDYASASHGSSFHAPLEVMRILTTATDQAQEARVLLARILAAHGHTGEVIIPDISTKDKAQKLIGLDMPKLRAQKEEFIKTVLPVWDAGPQK